MNEYFGCITLNKFINKKYTGNIDAKYCNKIHGMPTQQSKSIGKERCDITHTAN